MLLCDQILFMNEQRNIARRHELLDKIETSMAIETLRGIQKAGRDKYSRMAFLLSGKKKRRN